MRCVLSMHPPSINDVDRVTHRLSVVRCALTQPKKNNDWRRSSIFQTLTKIGGKNFRVIIDNGSCVNTVASGMLTKLGLKIVFHPQSYKVSWVNSASINVKERCLVSILFATYADKTWCDVITMDMGHIILERLWLYDRNVTIYERPNSCSFVYEGKITLAPLRLGSLPATKQTEASSSKKTLTLISPKFIDKEMAKGSTIVTLIAREVTDDSQKQIPSEAVQVFKKFADIFPKELPDSLLLMHDIQHAIDLISGSSLSNLPHYRMNLAEHAELKKQVDELLDKRFIKENLSSCFVPTLLTPKKDGSWRMCVNSRAIKKITIKYRFPIPKLNGMLDMMSEATILKSGYYQIQIRLGNE